MVENLRATFKEMLAEADWMEDATKTFAKDKVKWRFLGVLLLKILAFD